MFCSAQKIYYPNRTRKLLRPLVLNRVPAGFPSPADDYIEGRIDLNRDLIRHPLATFYVRVIGDSMEPLIQSGALVVVAVRGLAVPRQHAVDAGVRGPQDRRQASHSPTPQSPKRWSEVRTASGRQATSRELTS